VFLLLIYDHHAIQFRHCQGTQDHRIHDAESGCVHADAYGQRENRGDGETRGLPQLAKSVLQVLEQGLQENLRKDGDLPVELHQE
jgi:hypothetical protein